MNFDSSTTSFSKTYDDIKLIIGDNKVQPFLDQVKMSFNKKYSNQFYVSVRFIPEAIFDEEESEKEIQTNDETIITTTNLVKNEYIDITNGKEHLITLFKKPKTNTLQFSIKTKGCKLYEQPPLTSQYTSGWSDEFNCEIVVTETQVTTTSGVVIINRPIQYVNSYAIYNDQNLTGAVKGSHNYNSGKLGHIERFCAILPDNTIVWLKSYIIKDILYVELPDSIMNNDSIFNSGLIIHPTFGYTTFGMSSTSGYINKYVGNSYTASSSGTVTSMTVCCTAYNSSARVILGLYEDSTKRAQTDEIDPDSDTLWWESQLQSNYDITSGNSYKLIAHSKGSLYLQYDLYGPGTYYYDKGSYSTTFDDTVTFSTFTYYYWSMYATYTEGGSTPSVKPKKIYFFN